MLTADPQLLFRLSGGMIEQQDEASPLTLVSDEPVIPGISRFEQLCLQLIRQFRAPLIQRYPSGRLPPMN
jgi:hypothetical protein